MTTDLEKYQEPDVLTSLRVSLKEKEQAKKKIRQAHRQGRIDDDEFTARLNKCDTAKHIQNLQYLHADLPPLNKDQRKWWTYAATVLSIILVGGTATGGIAQLAAGSVIVSTLAGMIGVITFMGAVITIVCWVEWNDHKGD